MSKEQLYKIYDLILKGEKITTQKLNKYGISKSDLEEMIERKKIDRIGKDEYTIKSNESLYQFGISLTNNQEYERGIKYLEKYYELNPLNKEIKLVLISAYINRKQYQKIFPILDELLKTNNQKEKKDYLLILYLLSLTCYYPDKYKDIVLNIQYSDLLYNNQDVINDDIQRYNQMRIRILQNKFNQAETTFKTRLINTYSSKSEKDIIEKLIKSAKESDQKRNELLERYAKDKEYKNIISYIEKKKTRFRLSLGDELIYQISKDIIKIKETNKIPRPQVNEAENVKKAIEGKNYYLALKLNATNDKTTSNNHIRRAITILLVDINKLISSVIKEYKEKLAKEKEQINEINTNNESNQTKKRTLKKEVE